MSQMRKMLSSTNLSPLQEQGGAPPTARPLSHPGPPPHRGGSGRGGLSPFSNARLNIWKFMVHVFLKPGLENFEHYFTSV